LVPLEFIVVLVQLLIINELVGHVWMHILLVQYAGIQSNL